MACNGRDMQHVDLNSLKSKVPSLFRSKTAILHARSSLFKCATSSSSRWDEALRQAFHSTGPAPCTRLSALQGCKVNRI
eukprot:1738856-Amphidinium_carterae.1